MLGLKLIVCVANDLHLSQRSDNKGKRLLNSSSDPMVMQKRAVTGQGLFIVKMLNSTNSDSNSVNSAAANNNTGPVFLAGNASQNHTGTFQVPPIISLHFEELKREMHQFGAIFTDWVADKRRALTDDKESFLKTISEEADAVEGLKKQYAQLQAKKQQVIQNIEQEELEYEEMLKTNAELRDQRHTLAARLDELKSKGQQLQADIAHESAIFSQFEAKREKELARARAELADFQKHLGFFLEPLPNHQTRFSFIQVDPVHPTDRACSFVVDVSQDQYRVLHCEPMIPDMQNLVNELNQHRDFYRFLKICRQSFVNLFVS